MLPAFSHWTQVIQLTSRGIALRRMNALSLWLQGSRALVFRPEAEALV